MTARGSRLAAIPALLLVLVAVWEIVATRLEAASVPDDDAWAAAAAVVRHGYRPGDLIVFEPPWADPIGRLHLGDLISIDMAARMDGARYGRIWEISVHGARSRETSGLEPVEEHDIHALVVRRYERTPVTVLADIVDMVAPPPARVELSEVGFEPHRCVLVVPQPNTPMRITYKALPLGSELVGYVGLADVFTRRDVREPGKLDIEIGGVIVGSATAGVDDGWVRFRVVTTPGPTDVTFVVRADKPGRNVCFAAEARK